MGVPKFYRWLSERYPLMNQPITRYPDEKSKEEIMVRRNANSRSEVDTYEVNRSVDLNELNTTTSPDISHLYIDLNGVLHGCAHNNADQTNLGDLEEEEVTEQTANENEGDMKDRIRHDEIIDHVEAYLDRLIGDIARPTTLVYIAIDGVAPRAKLNQQRARRFKTGAESSSESMERDYEAQRNSAGTLSGTITVDLDMQKALQNKSVEEDDGFYKGNSITPGTVFMQEITERIERFVSKRANEGVWASCENKAPQIIFSGGDVPGEGEHKIMDYIRSLDLKEESRKQGNHCIVGQDGDLIMLGLMTKLRNICLLREHVVFLTLKQLKQASPKSTRDGINEYVNNHKFEFLRMGILRDYIALEFGCKPDSNNLASSDRLFDLNRTIDDILFMFLFIGNDFLPNIPSIDIGDGGLDILLSVYKNSRSTWKDPYLTENGKILDYGRLQSYFARVQNLLYDAKTDWRDHLIGDIPISENNENPEESMFLSQFKNLFIRSIFNLEKEEKDESKSLHRPSNMKKLKSAPLDRLENLYYTTKFPSKPSPYDVVANYFQTVQWVLDYYYRGVDSAGWGHYYQYHYGPMLHNITDFSGEIAAGNKVIEQVDKTEEPLPPLLQLLGCLPPSSAHLLPKELRPILFEDKNGYYPRSFKIDLNGKRNHWESSVLLPFIDAQSLRLEANKFTGGKLGTHGSAWIYEKNEKHAFKNNATNEGTEFVGNTKYDSITSHIYPTLVAPNISTPFPKLRFIGLNIFGKKSRYRTLVLNIPDNISSLSTLVIPNAQALAKSLIGKSVMFNYPYLQEGFVTSISDQKHNIRGEKCSPVYEGYGFFNSRLYSQLERGKGVVGSGGIGLTNDSNNSIVLYIRPFKRLTMDEGQLFKEFADFEIQLPLSYCLYGVGSDFSTHLDKFPTKLGSDPYLSEDETRRVFELDIVKRAVTSESQRKIDIASAHSKRSKMKGNRIFPTRESQTSRRRRSTVKNKKHSAGRSRTLNHHRRRLSQPLHHGDSLPAYLPAPIDFDRVMKRNSIGSRSLHCGRILEKVLPTCPMTVRAMLSTLSIAGLSSFK